jgi:integrase/recombinase XerD
VSKTPLLARHNRTICLVLDDHLNHIALTGHRPRTVQSRREVLVRFSEQLGDRPLSDATLRDVERFLGRHLSPASRRTYLSHLRAYYRWALRLGLVLADPTADVGSIRVPQGVPRPMDASDLTLALAHATPRMRAWLLLMSLAGLRCLEVAGLRPQDVTDVAGMPVLYLRETKGGGSATVPAHSAIIEALNALPIRDQAWWTVGARTVSTDVGRYLKALGIGATAHQLRHRAGTDWYEASGHDLLTTARLLRHAQVSTTQVYARIDPTRPAEVVRLVPAPLSA